jgi:hypothetical protein
MSGKPKIVCACGRQIEAREILQHGYFMSHWEPVWVYVKYRCSRCKMMGEKLVDYKNWDESVLECEGAEPTSEEATRFLAMGQIGDEELDAFAEAISTLRPSDLDKLARSLT